MQHHGQADQGAWTIEQLRGFKDSNRNGAAARLKGQFHWRRDRLILLAGGNWWSECSVLLQYRSTPIIWLSRDSDGYELLNLDLFDEQGVPRLRLRDNDWIVDRDVEDLECPPKKASLMIKTGTLGAELSLSFSRATPELVRKRAIDIAGQSDMSGWPTSLPRQSAEELGADTATQILEGIPEENSALCVVEGRLRWPIDLRLEPTQMVFAGGGRMSGCLMGRCSVGIQFG
jgi:hypothetical protein